jgi:hypothetical protein
MLYLLATQQARDRQEVARLLGVYRNTIGRWLVVSAAERSTRWLHSKVI